MNCHREILGIRWSHFVSNVDVRTRTGLTPLGEILAARHISVCGHIARLESDVPAHMQVHRFVSSSSSWSRLETTSW